MTNDERRQNAIDNTYRAVQQIQKVLLQDIDLEMLDPEKAKAAVEGKKSAQFAIFDMIERAEEEQALLDSAKGGVSAKQEKINNATGGIAENFSK